MAAVAAQGMAMAAGIRDPHTLAIIGVVAGAAAGGLAAALKGTMKYGAEEIAKAAGAPQWLVSVASLGISLVNSDNLDQDPAEGDSPTPAATSDAKSPAAKTGGPLDEWRAAGKPILADAGNVESYRDNARPWGGHGVSDSPIVSDGSLTVATPAPPPAAPSNARTCGALDAIMDGGSILWGVGAVIPGGAVPATLIFVPTVGGCFIGKLAAGCY